ncbi:MAG: cupin domain-containing protein [Blastocatellia bacterium]
MQSNNHQEDFQARAALYALGALSPAEARAFEDELTIAADVARAEVAEFDAVVAQLGLSVEEATPSAQLRAHLLTRIADETPTANPSHHVDVFRTEGAWQPLFPGGEAKVLFQEPTNGYITSLLKLEAGARIPNHHHHGNEQCMVMAGEFQMNGKLYQQGDFTVALDGSEHLEIYSPTGGVLLIVSPPDYEVVR